MCGSQVRESLTSIRGLDLCERERKATQNWEEKNLTFPFFT